MQQRSERSTVTSSNPFSLSNYTRTQTSRLQKQNSLMDSESDFLRLNGLSALEKHLSSHQGKVHSEKHSLAAAATPFPIDMQKSVALAKTSLADRDSTLSDITQIIKNNGYESRGGGIKAGGDKMSQSMRGCSHQNSVKGSKQKGSSFKKAAGKLKGSTLSLLKGAAQQNNSKRGDRGTSEGGAKATQGPAAQLEQFRKLMKGKNIQIKKDEMQNYKLNFYPEMEGGPNFSDRSDLDALDQKAIENMSRQKHSQLRSATHCIIDENEENQNDESAKKKHQVNVTPRLHNNYFCNKENNGAGGVTHSKSSKAKGPFQKLDLNRGPSQPSATAFRKKLSKDSAKDAFKSPKGAYNLAQMRSPNQGQFMGKDAALVHQQFQKLSSVKEEPSSSKKGSDSARSKQGIGLFNYQNNSCLSYQKILSEQLSNKSKGSKVRNQSPKTDKPFTKMVSKMKYEDPHQRFDSPPVGRNSSVPLKFMTDHPSDKRHSRKNSSLDSRNQCQFSLVKSLKKCENEDNSSAWQNFYHNPARFSKASDSTVGAPEIGEETQSNFVNETKTIKEKMGRDYNSTQAREEVKKKAKQLSLDEQISRYQESSLKKGHYLKKSMHYFSPSEMKAISQQEKNFFEITRFVMYKDSLVHNFPEMSQTTKQAFEFMKKVLQDQHLQQMYLQTCKVDLLVQFLVQRLGEDLRRAEDGDCLLHYFKTVLINVHKSILTYLELATSLNGDSSLDCNMQAATQQIHQNLEVIFRYLASICKHKEQEKVFQELKGVVQRMQLVKNSSQGLQVFEQILFELECKDRASQHVHKTPNSAERYSKRANLTREIINSEQKPKRNPGPISQLLSREGICPKIQEPDSIQSVKYLKHHQSMSPVRSKRAFILPNKRECFEQTLVLDLDETLVHYEASERKFKLRPNCSYFLKNASQLFEIVIFTAASQDYADFILNALDPQNQFIQYRLYRQHTEYDDGVYVKDLSKLGRDLSKTIIIDNIKENFERQDDNGIEIKTWTSDPADRELDVMLRFLRRAHGAKDVRPLVKEFKEQYQQHLNSPPKNPKVHQEGDDQKKTNFSPSSEKKGPEAKFIR